VNESYLLTFALYGIRLFGWGCWRGKSIWGATCTFLAACPLFIGLGEATFGWEETAGEAPSATTRLNLFDNRAMLQKQRQGWLDKFWMTDGYLLVGIGRLAWVLSIGAVDLSLVKWDSLVFLVVAPAGLGFRLRSCSSVASVVHYYTLSLALVGCISRLLLLLKEKGAKGETPRERDSRIRRRRVGVYVLT